MFSQQIIATAFHDYQRYSSSCQSPSHRPPDTVGEPCVQSPGLHSHTGREPATPLICPFRGSRPFSTMGHSANQLGFANSIPTFLQHSAFNVSRPQQHSRYNRKHVHRTHTTYQPRQEINHDLPPFWNGESQERLDGSVFLTPSRSCKPASRAPGNWPARVGDPKTRYATTPAGFPLPRPVAMPRSARRRPSRAR